MSTTTTAIQTAVSDIVTANLLLLKHHESNEIIKSALYFLQNKECGYYKNFKQIQFEANIILSIYLELYKYKYYRTLPDWSNLVNYSFETIKKEITQDNYKEKLAKAKFVKDCILPIFIVLKQKLVDEAFLKEVTDFISRLHQYSAYNDIINTEAEKRFWKYYDPARPNDQINIEKESDTEFYDDNEAGECISISSTDDNSSQIEKNSAPWKTFLYRSYRWAENSFNESQKIKNKDDKNKINDNEDQIRIISLNTPLENDSGTTIIETMTTTEEIDYTWFYDMLRDLIITNLKNISTKNQLKYQLCFFTDDISCLLNESLQFYRHLRIYEKHYSPTINLDFLNFFVDYPCSSIISSYHKPRKPISQFNNRKTNDSAPCDQPLELCVYASFFKQTEQNISEQRKIYKKRRAEFMAEHYSEYV